MLSYLLSLLVFPSPRLSIAKSSSFVVFEKRARGTCRAKISGSASLLHTIGGDFVWGGMWGWIGSLADQKWPFLGLAKTGLAKAAMSELSP